MRDVADYLGLSATTVSLVLNNSPIAQTLSKETRSRVLQAAAKLNYRANYFARALNQKRNYLIGVLVPDFGEGYNAQLITEIESELIERKYLYFVSSHHWSQDLIQQRLESFAERGVEGIILINTPVLSVPNLPIVVIGNQKIDSPHWKISLDNLSGIRLACEHLYTLGHRKIAFMRGHSGSSDSELRWKGFLETSRALGLKLDPELVVQLDRIHDGLEPIREGYEASERLLSGKKDFSSLIAFNDMSAVGAIQRFKAAGLRVPEDISVIGFDNVTVSQIVDPPLTTLAQPSKQIAKLATAEILRRVEGDANPKRHKLIQPDLIIRQSTSRPS